MKQNTYIIIAVVIIIAIAGGYYVMHKSHQASQQNMMVQPTQQTGMEENKNEGQENKTDEKDTKDMGDSHTLTWADNGKHIYLEPNDTLIISLDDGTTAKWTATLSDPTVFSDVSKGMLPAHVAGMYKAEKFGEEKVSATNNMTGASAKMFNVTIRVVKDDNDPKLPSY